MKLVLGSASPRRKQILTEMGFKFDVIKPDIDEKAIRDSDPRKLVLALACAKADAVIAKMHEPAIVITSDQVVAFDGRTIEKPQNADEARQMLKNYHEAAVETVTSVVVTNIANHARYTGVDVATIYFKEFSDDAIEKIIQNAEINVMDRAGGFAVEHPLVTPFVKKIQGDLDSIQGLPKTLLSRLLDEARK